MWLCAVLILAGGIQQGIFSQTVDSHADEEAGTEVSGGAGAAREAERGYLLAEDAAVPQTPSGGLSVWAVFRTVMVLALAAVAVYGVVYILKRKKNTDAPDDTHLKVLARVPITIKTSAVVIAAGNKAWLAGVSDNGVSVIAEITDKETVDAMLLAYAERAAASKSAGGIDFARLLRRLGGTGDAPPAPAGAPSEASGIPQTPGIRRSRERLKNL